MKLVGIALIAFTTMVPLANATVDLDIDPELADEAKGQQILLLEAEDLAGLSEVDRGGSFEQEVNSEFMLASGKRSFGAVNNVWQCRVKCDAAGLNVHSTPTSTRNVWRVCSLMGCVDHPMLECYCEGRSSSSRGSHSRDHDYDYGDR